LKILTGIITILFLGLVPYSCRKCDGFGPLQNVNITDTDLLLFKQNSSEIIEDSVFYDADSLFAGLYITQSVVAWRQSKSDFGFVSTAQACSPPLPMSLQWVTDISVVSNSDVVFNQNLSFSSGDTLNDLFMVSHSYNPFNYTVDEYLEQEMRFQSTGEILRLGISETVSSEVEVDCNFRFELSNGSIYEFPNVVIRIR